MNRRAWVSVFMVVVLGGVGVAGCRRQQQARPSAVPEVAVVTIEPQPVVLTTQLPGFTSAYLVAEIRPQVNGLIQKRLFTEGADVEAGQVLYQIDPAPFQAEYDNAMASLSARQRAADQAEATLQVSEATVKRHEATLALAKRNFQRLDNLFKTSAASAMERDQAMTDVNVADATLRAVKAQVESDREAIGAAKATIKQAEAALQTAKINLDYTEITAPISGRIGRSSVTEGAIVTAYQPVPLATIQKLDPIYVDVKQSTVELNRLRRRLASGRLKDNGTDQVKIILDDNTAYPLAGTLKFRDVTVDPSTGSVIFRIVVPNPDGILLPGMFVRARVDEGVNEHAILVPQQAVSRDPKGNPITWVVDSDGRVQQRGIAIDRALGDQWLTSSGLAEGDRVIMEGIQKVRPGDAVKAVPFEAGQTAAAVPGTRAAVAR